MPLFGLADCNNFYCSCERVFQPDLRNKPVVVLSNNDGCIIARSNEAKALGLKMGTPFFQVRDVLDRNGVAVFSSNYNLYGDMSRRVMSLLSHYTPTLEVYSIDEAFLDLSGMGTSEQLLSYSRNMVKTVTKATGIPISLGIGPTRTLAKMASKFAKKHSGYQGVCLIDTDEKREKALKLLDISDVWGIGPRHTATLSYHGINTAWDFTQKSESWVRKFFTVTGVRTWKELRGISCINVDDLPHKKSVCTSRSFADQGLCNLSDLEEAVSNFAAQCARKLREQHTICAAITVFACTSRFRTDLPGNVIHRTVQLQVPTNDHQELVSLTARLLRSQWQGDSIYHYKNAGVIVSDIHRDDAIQTSIFDTIDRNRQTALAKAVDAINRKHGHNTLRMAVQGFDKNWKLKNEYISRQYTTNPDEIIEVKV